MVAIAKAIAGQKGRLVGSLDVAGGQGKTALENIIYEAFMVAVVINSGLHSQGEGRGQGCCGQCLAGQGQEIKVGRDVF